MLQNWQWSALVCWDNLMSECMLGTLTRLSSHALSLSHTHTHTHTNTHNLVIGQRLWVYTASPRCEIVNASNTPALL